MLSDGRRKLFNFGPHEADARAALEVLRRYEFNEVGFIGSPGPSMSYLLKNDSPTRRHFTALGQANQTDDAPALAPRYPLDLPGLGRVGEPAVRRRCASRSVAGRTVGTWRPPPTTWVSRFDRVPGPHCDADRPALPAE